MTTAKKTTTTTATAIPENMCSSEKKEKKEKKKTRNRGCSERTQVVRCYLGRARRPGSRGGLDLARLDRRAHLHFFFFFFSSLSFSLFFLSFRIFLLFLHLGSLIIIIFGLEIESQRLNFHVDAMWKRCHIRRKQLMKIESQKIDLQTLNRVTQTRIASKKYSLKT